MRQALSVGLALLAASAGGCSWLIGVSEDPVVGDLALDASADHAADGADAEPRDAAPE